MANTLVLIAAAGVLGFAVGRIRSLAGFSNRRGQRHIWFGKGNEKKN